LSKGGHATSNAMTSCHMISEITKLFLPKKGSLAEAKQACNQNHQKASKVVFWDLRTAFQALMHEEGQALGVCLAF